MKIRAAFVLLFCLTNIAFADGTYQKTRDGKTRVWNNNPQPGDQASWSGKRDDEGYASGRGTLTWYRTEKKIVTGSNVPLPKYAVVASYTGEMLRGKLNGDVVALDASGKKFHGTYVDGHRKNWAAGNAKEVAKQEPMTRRGELVEEPPAPAQGPEAEPSVEPTAAKAAPEKSAAPAQQAAKPAPQSKPGEFDDSLRSLVGPPNALRNDTGPTARSTSSPAPAASASPSPR